MLFHKTDELLKKSAEEIKAVNETGPLRRRFAHQTKMTGGPSSGNTIMLDMS